MSRTVMKLAKEGVQHIAGLARLKLSPAEIERYAKELTAIVGYIEQLNELDTKNVEPTYHVVPAKNVFRKDETKTSFTPDELLSSAPDHDQHAIRVPKIIEAL